MTDREIALRTAINVLHDSIESGRMPSGLRLTDGATLVHELAVSVLEAQLKCATRLSDEGPFRVMEEH